MANVLNQVVNKTQVLKRYAELLCKQHIEFSITKGNRSFSRNQNGKIAIVISPQMVMDDEDNYSQLFLKTEGIVAHEAAHILYSDFDIVKENFENLNFWQKEIQNAAKKWRKDKTQENANYIRDCIYHYIYFTHLVEMLNSIEDAAIEFQMPYHNKKTYQAILATRNYVVTKELELLESQYENQNFDDISLYITEIRHLSTVGYRKNLKSNFLKKLIKDKKIKKSNFEEIKALSYYSRSGSSSTRERNSIAKILLKRIDCLLQEKTDVIFIQYLEALIGDELVDNEKDLENMMNNLMEDTSTPELTINSMNPNMPSSLKPQENSKYEMDLPEYLQDEINKQTNEDEDSSSNQSSENQSSQVNESSNNEANQSSQVDESSNNEATSNSDDFNNEAKNDNDDNNALTNEGSVSNEESNENKAINSKEDKQNNYQDEGLGTDSEKEFENLENFNKKIEANIGTEKLNADTLVEKSVQSIQKELEKLTKNQIKQNILNPEGSRKTPKLENALSDISMLTDIHKNVKVEYIASKYLADNYSREGKDALNEVMECKKIATKFAKRFHELLQYQAYSSTRRGLSSGVLNSNALPRALIDGKVFQKKQQGIEKKGRVEVLLDLSGSMYGKKLVYAIQAAYILLLACQKTKIPISIMGHNTSARAVNLFHFVEFENYLKSNAYQKLFTAEANGANQDGLAIFHAATDLVRHAKKDEELILIVISDGAPAGISPNYYGEFAIKDIQRITNTFEKQFKIKTIGIGIGNDCNSVLDIYKNYLVVPDVSQLSNNLLKILKQLLLVK